MIPNVRKGGSMRGLLRYLADTREHADGKRNIHTEPHVVGGDPFLQVLYGSVELDMSDAGDIASYLDAPRKQWGTTVESKVWTQDAEGNRVPVLDASGSQVMRDEHVWHCSLTLPAEDGSLTTQEW